MDVHDYPKRIRLMRNVLLRHKDGVLAYRFLVHLQARGLSLSRLHAYATKLLTVLKYFEQVRANPTAANKTDIERIMALINEGQFTVGKTIGQYKPWTKARFAITLKKFIQYTKTGRTKKDQPYPPEVSWIKPNVREDESRATPDGILSEEDFVQSGLGHQPSMSGRARKAGNMVQISLGSHGNLT